MPIYEYACDDCQENFEVFVGINDAPVQQCTMCEGKNIRKLISNCSFQLKGTGWYKTDYADKNSGSSDNGKEPKEGEKKADSTGSASASSESKESSSDKKDSSKDKSSEKAA